MTLSDLAALAILTAATIYLVRRFVRNFQGKSEAACDKCAPQASNKK